jgi:SAM-dependent methyltransferase
LSREVVSDLTMLERLIVPGGKDVVDIGCGAGGLVRELTGLGARVVGVDVSDQQLAAARARDDQGGARYLVGRAQELPLQDGTIDVAVFMRSLHHVPPADLVSALAEAARVLRPGGVVYVAEPLAEGDYFQLVSLVDDETAVRAAAQHALAKAASAGLRRRTTVDYDVAIAVTDIESLRLRVVSSDPARAPVFDAHVADLEQALATLGEPAEGARMFLQPMRADLLVAD